MQERRSEVTAKQAPETAKSRRVFGQARKPAKMFRAGLYARVSTNDQQTIPLQIRALREYVGRRGWTIALQVKEVGSGRIATATAGGVAGSSAPPRDRRGFGVAIGSLGSVGGGSAGHAPSTCPP